MAELYRLFVSHLAAQKQSRKTDALLERHSYIVAFFTSGVRLCDDTDKGCCFIFRCFFRLRHITIGETVSTKVTSSSFAM